MVGKVASARAVAADDLFFEASDGSPPPPPRFDFKDFRNGNPQFLGQKRKA